MPNPSVPAAAEGVPTEALALNRISELAQEISRLLDRAPGADFALIMQSSRPGAYHVIMGAEENGIFFPSIGAPAAGVKAIQIIAVEDKLSEAVDMVSLVSLALDSLSADEETKGLSAGVNQIFKELRGVQDSLSELKEFARLSIFQRGVGDPAMTKPAQNSWIE